MGKFLNKWVKNSAYLLEKFKELFPCILTRDTVSNLFLFPEKRRLTGMTLLIHLKLQNEAGWHQESILFLLEVNI